MPEYFSGEIRWISLTNVGIYSMPFHSHDTAEMRLGIGRMPEVFSDESHRACIRHGAQRRTKFCFSGLTSSKSPTPTPISTD